MTLGLLGACAYPDPGSSEWLSRARAAVAKHPREPMSWSLLGANLLRAGEVDQAIEAYSRVLELAPEESPLPTSGSPYDLIESSVDVDEVVVQDGPDGKVVRRVEAMTPEGAIRMPIRADARDKLGVIYRMRGEWARSEELLWEALATSERRLHGLGRGAHLLHLGELQLNRGDLAGAGIACSAALEQYEMQFQTLCTTATGERKTFPFPSEDAVACGTARRGKAQSFTCLGAVHRQAGELERAEQALERARDFDGGRWTLAIGAVDRELARLWRAQGKLDAAEDRLQRALHDATEDGHVYGIADALRELGLVSHDRGREAPAQDFWRRALELYRKLGLPAEIRWCEQQLGSAPAEASGSTS